MELLFVMSACVHTFICLCGYVYMYVHMHVEAKRTTLSFVPQVLSLEYLFGLEFAKQAWLAGQKAPRIHLWTFSRSFWVSKSVPCTRGKSCTNWTVSAIFKRYHIVRKINLESMNSRSSSFVGKGRALANEFTVGVVFSFSPGSKSMTRLWK